MGTQYTQLSVEERALFQAKLESGLSIRQIARSMGRAPSTLSRELRRNGAWERKAKLPTRGRPCHYRIERAQHRARACAAKPRVARKLRLGDEHCLLWCALRALLAQKYSPEQAGRILRLMHPNEPNLHLSHESVYSALYAMPQGELRADIVAMLRRERASRRPHRVGPSKRGRIVGLVPISQRPSEVDERVIPGHWEGDLIKGKAGASAVGTLVERSSLFTVLAKMRSGKTLDCVPAFASVLNRFDSQLRLSLTYDRGREMAAHAKLTELAQVKVFFADPHSPWQRGINENTNGLLRQYLPRGLDLSVYSQDELDAIAWALNTRPRKSLGWRCPAQLIIPDFDYKAYFLQTFGDLTKLKPVALGV